MRVRWPALVTLVALLGWARGAPAQDADQLVAAGHLALQERNVPAAREAVVALDRLGDAGAEGMLLRARYHQFAGDHEAALEAIRLVPEDPRDAALRAVVEAGARWMADAVEHRSDHFVLRHPAGLDSIWADRALEVLEATHDRVGGDLGLYPDEPVLVEVYATSASFAEATGLPREAVANDTVGLCRWDRLFVTSPLAASFGYPWADTLCHEYTHLLVDRLGGGRIPVWLHEGIASFEQSRWRGGDDAPIPPSRVRLLAEALERDELVTLEEIGNCLACLESPARVQLAFVQVHTLVDHLIRSRGIDALREALIACRMGAEVEDALAVAWGASFADLWASWRDAIASQAAESVPAAGVVGLDLDGSADPGTETVDSVLAGQPRGVAHARLGDLLAARGQRRAALLEYGRAERHLTDVSPALACKKAAVLRELGLAGQALAEVEAAGKLYPEFEPLLVNQARAQIDLGREEQALRTLDEAELINPFDPRIHAWRLELLDPEGDAAAHDAAREALEALTDHMIYDGTEPGMAR